MKSVSKIVHIYRKYGGIFATVNKAVLQEGSQHIGSSVNGKKAMMLRDVEMRDYMPLIIGTQPSDPKFLERLNKYWDELSVSIPEQGRALEIGFLYDVSNPAKVENIKLLAKEHKVEITSDEKLATLVEAHIETENKWKYGIPISLEDYSLWRYCQNYGDVANTKELATKSSRIRFFIHDDSIDAAEKSQQFKLRNEAGKLYFALIQKPDEVENILYAGGYGDKLSGKTSGQKLELFEEFKNVDPKRFIAIAGSTDLKELAYIERLIVNHHLVRDLESKYIKTTDDGTVLGRSAREAVAFLNDESNAKLRNDLQGRLKHSS